MIWPPQNTGLFELKMPCCACNPCPGKLLIPYSFVIGDTDLTYDKFADATAAAAALATNVVPNFNSTEKFVQDSCLLVGRNYAPFGGPGFATKTATFTSSYTPGASLMTVMTMTPPGAGTGTGQLFLQRMVSLDLKAGSTLTIAISNNQTFIPSIFIFDCAGKASGIELEFYFNSSTDFGFTAPIPKDSQYLVLIDYGGNAATGSTFADTITFTSDDTLTADPITAMYDDGGGGTAYLDCT